MSQEPARIAYDDAINLLKGIFSYKMDEKEGASSVLHRFVDSEHVRSTAAEAFTVFDRRPASLFNYTYFRLFTPFLKSIIGKEFQQLVAEHEELGQPLSAEHANAIIVRPSKKRCYI